MPLCSICLGSDFSPSWAEKDGPRPLCNKSGLPLGKRGRMQQQAMPMRTWDVRFVVTCWLLWKQHNNVIFSGSLTPADVLAREIIHEGDMWLRSCK